MGRDSQSKHTVRKRYERDLLYNILGSASDSIVGNFTLAEIESLCHTDTMQTLKDIMQIHADSIACVSILDSTIQGIKRHLNDGQDYENISLYSNLNKQQGDVANGFHIIVKNLFTMAQITKDCETHNETQRNAEHNINFADFTQSLIHRLKPWRKGPFYLHFQSNNTLSYEKELKNKMEVFCVDSEWKSTIKMQLIYQALSALHYDIRGKDILDVGCNNGYYMFDLALRAKHVTGIDPVRIFFLQFLMLYRLSGLDNISFRLLGVKDVSLLQKQFDLVLCLGVLYHRKEPLQTLIMLKRSLKEDGVALLETLIIHAEEEIALCPYPTYAKMSNVFYIFSPKALANLAKRAGFKECSLISFSYTDRNEQRTTDFIIKQSLGDFLNKESTTEGYPPACRGIFALR